MYIHAKEIMDELIQIRREIHEHPEIGFDTIETANKVEAVLKEANISYRRTSRNGIIAEVKGTKKDSDKVVMLRGDMDALYVEEKTGLSYCSKEEGKMHACGHDIHTTMLLGSALILNKRKDEFAGTVRFLFQPAEEISGGALHLIEEGAMENVCMGLGIHLDPLLEVGKLGARRGADWAAVDHFYITVKGVGAHGATPHDGKDAIVAASTIVSSLQTLVSREFNPTYPLVVTVGKFHAGTSFNIIAQEAKLEGTCRSFDEEVYMHLPSAMERIVTHIAKAYGCEAEIQFDRVSKPLINSDIAFDALEEVVEKTLGKKNFIEAKLAMIGEDFSEYSRYAPCIFAHLGASGSYPLHSSYVNFQEDCMEYGIELEVEFALHILDKE